MSSSDLPPPVLDQSAHLLPSRIDVSPPSPEFSEQARRSPSSHNRFPPVQHLKPRIALVAGETSGDQLGAQLIDALRCRFPNAEFVGIGGDAMRSAGCQTWYDASELSVMGFVEVLGRLSHLRKIRNEFRQSVLNWSPDIVIGIDAPDFNLGLERWFKQHGILTVHYVSPSVWAWREKRVDKIGLSADQVLCLFPMEPSMYAKHGVDARYVGHPLADAIPLEPDRLAARAKLDVPPNAPLLALLPGSRRNEIERLSSIFFDAAWQISESIPGMHIVIPAANANCYDYLSEQLSNSILRKSSVRLTLQQSRDALSAADVALIASGTATLEAMLCKCPMVVAYRIAAMTYGLVKTLNLVKVQQYSLPNILAGETLVPELIQGNCTSQNLANEALDWFHNKQRVAAVLPKFFELHKILRRDASQRAAEAVSELIQQDA